MTAGFRAAVPGGDSPWHIFLVFLRLGLTSFGGPVAHLGYFRAELVQRRAWLDDRRFSDLVALCQFLPGPASSQVGIALGLLRGGWAGSLAAWLGFTLPSACLMLAFAQGLAQYRDALAGGALHGLKIAAVAVVAQAVWGMSRTLCPDRPRAALAIGAALWVLAQPSPASQVVALVICGLLGRAMLPAPAPAGAEPLAPRLSRRAGGVALAWFAALLLGLHALALVSPVMGWLAGLYRAGALVFGGGHVVLPLLQALAVPSGALSAGDFMAGYGLAQALPGPLFTFAAFLGALMPAPLGGWVGGCAALVAIFAPAYLLVVGALPFWDPLRRHGAAQAALAGVNAGVVGVLLAALYDPVWVGAIGSRADFGLALLSFGLLVFARLSPALVVPLAAALGWGAAAL